MKYVITFLELFCFLICYGQKNDNNWLFSHNGLNTSLLDFGTEPIEFNLFQTIPISSTNAAISDDEGNILYFSNGLQINNFLNEMVENGDSINMGYWADQTLSLIHI